MPPPQLLLALAAAAAALALATGEPVFLTVCGVVGVGVNVYKIAHNPRLTPEKRQAALKQNFIHELEMAVDEAFAEVAPSSSPSSSSFKALVAAQNCVASLVSAHYHCQHHVLVTAITAALQKVETLRARIKQSQLTSEEKAFAASSLFEFTSSISAELLSKHKAIHGVHHNALSLEATVAQFAAESFVRFGMKDQTLADMKRKHAAGAAVNWGGMATGVGLSTLAAFLDPSGLSIAAAVTGAAASGGQAFDQSKHNMEWKVTYCPVIVEYARDGHWDRHRKRPFAEQVQRGHLTMRNPEATVDEKKAAMQRLASEMRQGPPGTTRPGAAGGGAAPGPGRGGRGGGGAGGTAATSSVDRFPRSTAFQIDGRKEREYEVLLEK